MSGIPYNRLQTVEATAKTSNGETVVIETLHYAFVVPCRDCKHMQHNGWCPNIIGAMPPDGFCAWGEREKNNKTDDFVTHDSGAKVVGE